MTGDSLDGILLPVIMTNPRDRERWQETGQPNVAFPHKVQNEKRLRRSLGNPAFNTPARIGAAVFIAYFFGIAAVLFATLQFDNAWREHLASIVLGMLLIFGPIFAVIAWATRRSLRSAHDSSEKRKH